MPDFKQPIDRSSSELSPEMIELVQRLDENNRPGSAAMLKEILDLGFQIVRSSHVVWLPRAKGRIQQQQLIPQWNGELESVFAGKSPVQITVSDVFHGYATDETAKIVLGVQVASAESLGSHIVKLGGNKVEKDYAGWKTCFLARGVASRLFMQVEGRELLHERYAVIYQDAYHLFGTDPERESPKAFEQAAEWAIMDSKPDVRSAERMLVQVFRELNRCLYQDARDDRAATTRVTDFYSHELSRSGPNAVSALDRWRNEAACQQMRRDALWLTTARAKPDAIELPEYLDPCDCMRWALALKVAPRTLVGRSHGDLHGRNIVVGVSGGQIEQPAIFDFGDMSASNLPVWDFVKLETELKTRILPKLFADSDAREKLALAVPPTRYRAAPHAVRLFPEEQAVADRTDRLEFAYQFETRLAWLTNDIISRDVAEQPRPAERRNITGHPAIDKALCLFYQLRQEAALALGYAVNRVEHWRDEFYFALSAYGLLKAKWNIEAPQLEWSLMSAGVAAAQVGLVRRSIGAQLAEFTAPGTGPAAQLSHLPTLKRSHEMWKSGRSADACNLLETALVEFPAAVTLRAEYALSLAATRNLAKAREQATQLHRFCHIFGDHEMLCRLARVFKDSADEIWADDRNSPDHASFVAGGHPAWQLYREAFDLYLKAFKFSRHFFPGINAATLALLTGQYEVRLALAEEVLDVCRTASTADIEERFWVYAAEGEAHLIKGAPNNAAAFYRAALAIPAVKQKGMIQAMYNQLCRLSWALGAVNVEPIVAELESRGLLNDLQPGPFGNCGRKQ